MEKNSFPKNCKRRPPPPPDFSKLLQNQVKSEDEVKSDVGTVVVPRAPHQKSEATIEKLKEEAVQLRANLHHLENSVIPNKTQEVYELQQKLSSMQTEMDKVKSDNKPTEEKYNDVVTKLLEKEVALNMFREKFESLSTSMETSICNLKRGHGEEVQLLESKLIKRNEQLEEERKLTCDLKQKLLKVAELHKLEVSSVVKIFRAEIKTLHEKSGAKDTEIERERKVSSKFNEELLALKTKMRQHDEQHDDGEKTCFEFQLNHPLMTERLQQKEEELKRVNKENAEVKKMMIQYRDELDKCEIEKISIREVALQESMELVEVNLERQKEIESLKARLGALKADNPQRSKTHGSSDRQAPFQSETEIRSKSLKRKTFDETNYQNKRTQKDEGSSSRKFTTYMTWLNTICNLGGNWPSTIALWLVDPLTTKVCKNDPENDCSSAALEKVCKDGESSCSTVTDGYNIESVACIVIGFVWLLAFGKRAVQQLEGSGGGSDSHSGWRVLEESSKNGKKVKNGPMKKTC